MPRALRAASTAEICGSLSAAHTPSVLQLQNSSSSFSMAPAGLGAPAPGLGARRRRPRREGGERLSAGPPRAPSPSAFPGHPRPRPRPGPPRRGPPCRGSLLRPDLRPLPRPAPPRPCSPPQVRLGSTLARGPLLRPDLRSRPRRRSPLSTPDPAVHLVRVSPGPRPGAAQSGSAPPLLPAPPPAPPRPRPVPGRPLGGALRRPDALRSHFSVLSSRGAGLPETPQTVPLSRGLGGYRLNPGRADVHPLTGGWTVVLGFCTP